MEQIVNGIITTLAAAITSAGQATISVTNLSAGLITAMTSGTVRIVLPVSITANEILVNTGSPTGAGPYTIPVARGQEGTTATTFLINTAIEIGSLTAAVLATKANATAVKIIHSDGTETIYATVANAVTAAVSGDTINVYQSATVNTNLAKNGVNWWFAPGVTITNNSNSAGYMFDDLNVACSYNVAGDGSFVRVITGADATVNGVAGFGSPANGSGGDVGVFNQSNASSAVNFEFNEIQLNWTGTNTNSVGYESAVGCINGNAYFRGKKLWVSNGFGSDVCLWWNLGNAFFDVQEIQGCAYWLYAACSNAATGSLYVETSAFDQAPAAIAVLQNTVIVNASSDPAAVTWIDAKVVNPGPGGAGIFVYGGKFYLTGNEKIYSGINASNSSSGSQTYITTQKIGQDNGGDFITAAGANTKVWIDCLKFDPTTAGRFISASAGAVVNLSGQDFSPLSGSNCINAAGAGTVVNLLSGIITTDAASKDLVQASSAVINANPGTYNANKTTGTITGIGQSITGSLAVGSAVALTTGTPVTVTSITLTTGTWDVTGSVAFHPGASTVTTYLEGGTNTTAATIGSLGSYFINPFAIATTGVDAVEPVPRNPIKVTAATQVVYLVAQAGFTVSTLSVYGNVVATRRL